MDMIRLSDYRKIKSESRDYINDLIVTRYTDQLKTDTSANKKGILP